MGERGSGKGWGDWVEGVASIWYLDLALAQSQDLV